VSGLRGSAQYVNIKNRFRPVSVSFLDPFLTEKCNLLAASSIILTER
jgi:hypothetical protein